MAQVLDLLLVLKKVVVKDVEYEVLEVYLGTEVELTRRGSAA